MKKWIKNVLIAAAIMAAAGLLLTGIGLIWGGIQGVENLKMSWGSEELLDLPNADDRYEVEAQGIRNLDIHWVAGEVSVSYWDGDTIVLQEDSRRDLTARTRLAYEVEQDTLKVEFLQGWNWFGLTRLDGKDLQVLVPQAMAGSLEKLELDVVSAQVDLQDLTVRKLEVDTVSGSVSGTGLTAGKASFDSVTGGIQVSFLDCPNALYAESVSGRLEFTLPRDSAFTLKAKSAVGGLTTDIPETPQADSHVDLDTISGAMVIRAGDQVEAEPETEPTKAPDVTTGATDD